MLALNLFFIRVDFHTALFLCGGILLVILATLATAYTKTPERLGWMLGTRSRAYFLGASLSLLYAAVVKIRSLDLTTALLGAAGLLLAAFAVYLGYEALGRDEDDKVEIVVSDGPSTEDDDRDNAHEW